MQRIANPSWGNTHARVRFPVPPPEFLKKSYGALALRLQKTNQVPAPLYKYEWFMRGTEFLIHNVSAEIKRLQQRHKKRFPLNSVINFKINRKRL